MLRLGTIQFSRLSYYNVDFARTIDGALVISHLPSLAIHRMEIEQVQPNFNSFIVDISDRSMIGADIMRTLDGRDPQNVWT